MLELRLCVRVPLDGYESTVRVKEYSLSTEAEEDSCFADLIIGLIRQYGTLAHIEISVKEE